jgi:YHS domain-containing protein
MTFLARVIRFLFWLCIVSWGVWFLRRMLGRMLQSAAAAPQHHPEASTEAQEPGAPRRLVRDPVCGVHVDETLSIPLREGGELLHFCSIACRDAYAGGTKKFAANG